MRKLTKKISMLMVLAMLVGLFSGVVSASAASAWSFKSGKYNVAVGGEINMKKNEYADFDLLKDGKAPEGYTVVWESSDEDVVWVNAKTGQLRADKAKKAEDGDKAVISATFTNTKTKKSATRSFTIVVGEVKAPVYTVEQADVTAVLGDAIKFAPVVKNEAGEVVKFATHKSYNGYFVDGKAITNPWTPEVAGEYTVTVAQFASKADVADLAKAVRKDEVKVTVKADFAAEATGVREITAYGDFAKDAKLTVKKGNSNVSITATKIAEDGKSAVLSTSNKLTKGTYTVTCGDATAEFAAEDEKVVSIVVLDDNGVITVDSEREIAYAHYDVFNQYGESVRKNYNVDWVSSTGVAPRPDRAKGVVEILAPTGDTFTYGSSIILTGVHTSNGSVATVNASMTVGLENRVDTVEIIGVVKEGTSELIDLPAGFTTGDYLLVYKAFDQMGYEMDYSATVGSNLAFTSLSPLLIGSDFAVATPVTIGSEVYGTVRLSRGIQANAGGVADIQVTSKQTGVTKIHQLTLATEQILTSFTLMTPDFVIAEGDWKPEIPFEAYDQNGKQVTSFRILHKAVSLGDTRFEFVKNNDGSAKIVFNVPANMNATENNDIPVVLTSTVVSTGDVSTITINVKDKSIPTTVKSIGSWTRTNVIEGGSISIDRTANNDGNGSCLKYYDQYDREMSNTSAYAYFNNNTNMVVAYKTTDDAFATTGGSLAIAGYRPFTTLTLSVDADETDTKKSQTVEFVIIDKTDATKPEVSNDTKVEFTAYDISQFRSFKFNPYSGSGDTKIENGVPHTYNSVVGVLANGGEADVPASYLVISAFDPTHSSSVTVATGGVTTPNFAAAKFDDYSVLKANGDPTHVTQNFDIIADIVVVNEEDETVVVNTAKQNVIVDNEDPHKTWFTTNFEGDTFTVQATNGKITYANLIKAALKKYNNNYDDATDLNNKSCNITATISKVVESEDGIHFGGYDSDNDEGILVVKKATAVGDIVLSGDDYDDATDFVMLENAETGDTFEVNFSLDWANATYKCVVGADTSAKFNNASTTVTWR